MYVPVPTGGVPWRSSQGHRLSTSNIILTQRRTCPLVNQYLMCYTPSVIFLLANILIKLFASFSSTEADENILQIKMIQIVDSKKFIFKIIN